MEAVINIIEQEEGCALSRKTPSDKPIKRKVVSVQLVDEEVARFEVIEQYAHDRNKLADRSALMRELLGLNDYGLTTDVERQYFQGKADLPKNHPARRYITESLPVLDTQKANELGSDNVKGMKSHPKPRTGTK
jgi:hypothetical protein